MTNGWLRKKAKSKVVKRTGKKAARRVAKKKVAKKKKA